MSWVNNKSDKELYVNEQLNNVWKVDEVSADSALNE